MLRGESSRGRTSRDLLHLTPERSCSVTMLLIALVTVRFPSDLPLDTAPALISDGGSFQSLQPGFLPKTLHVLFFSFLESAVPFLTPHTCLYTHAPFWSWGMGR